MPFNNSFTQDYQDNKVRQTRNREIFLSETTLDAQNLVKQYVPVHYWALTCNSFVHSHNFLRYARPLLYTNSVNAHTRPRNNLIRSRQWCKLSGRRDEWDPSLWIFSTEILLAKPIEYTKVRRIVDSGGQFFEISF